MIHLTIPKQRIRKYPVNLEKINLGNNSPAAFALVELLVAIAIFAVVITVVYTTLYTGLKTYHRTQVELKTNQEINQVLDRLSLELSNCYDADYDPQQDSGGFIADSQSISFFTIQNVYSQGSFKKLLARISYNFRDGKLFKRLQIDKDAFLDEEQFPQEELISDIKEFNIQYLYFKKIVFEGEDKYEWKSSWIDKDVIPKCIKIEIVRYDQKEDFSVSLTRYILLAQGEIPTQE